MKVSLPWYRIAPYAHTVPTPGNVFSDGSIMGILLIMFIDFHDTRYVAYK